ncbi:hypothetical protein F2Q68_00043288 [Brassica cretica]|uniref:Uncharacterized protein n=1 Tax=Brassica cretica TaxID=69181 RepID=A0A8S9LQH3_BRACR|nr:hypothetical protein F2Q68_00043288 [Brassica cretica]
MSNLSSLRTLRLRHNKRLQDVKVMKELQLLEHLEVVTIQIGSILVADQLVNAYREANAIQEISIRFVEEESILTLPGMAVLSTLEMYKSKMVEINVKRSTSSLNKGPTTPSFPNLFTVRLVFCRGLKDLTWLLFAPNLKLNSIYWSPLPFPLLRIFRIDSCPNLRKLPFDSKSGSSISGEDQLVMHNEEQDWIDKVEWEDEATKERFLRSIIPSH